MNKRQKKKLYKQETGKNPPKKMKYSGKSYHRAINKPWGGKKPTVNCSWDSEKLKEIATQFTKAWAGTRVTIEKAADALIKLFSGIGINISEASEKLIRGKYEKCGKYNKNINGTPQEKR